MKYLAFVSLPFFLTACGEKQEPVPPKGNSPVYVPTPATDTAKDPICGMQVFKTEKNHVKFDDIDVYFCSNDCLKRFNTDPTKYLKACPCAETKPPCGCDHCSKKCAPCPCSKKR